MGTYVRTRFRIAVEFFSFQISNLPTRLKATHASVRPLPVTPPSPRHHSDPPPPTHTPFFFVPIEIPHPCLPMPAVPPRYACPLTLFLPGGVGRSAIQVVCCGGYYRANVRGTGGGEVSAQGHAGELAWTAAAFSKVFTNLTDQTDHLQIDKIGRVVR